MTGILSYYYMNQTLVTTYIPPCAAAPLSYPNAILHLKFEISRQIQVYIPSIYVYRTCTSFSSYMNMIDITNNRPVHTYIISILNIYNFEAFMTYHRRCILLQSLYGPILIYLPTIYTTYIFHLFVPLLPFAPYIHEPYIDLVSIFFTYILSHLDIFILQCDMGCSVNRIVWMRGLCCNNHNKWVPRMAFHMLWIESVTSATPFLGTFITVVTSDFSDFSMCT